MPRSQLPAPSQFGVNGSSNCEFRSLTVGSGLGGGGSQVCATKQFIKSRNKSTRRVATDRISN